MKKYDPNNQCVWYGSQKRIWVDEQGLVQKIDPERFNQEWRTKLGYIMEYFHPNSLVTVYDNGYSMRLIKGHDLHGNLPFHMDGQNQSCALRSEQKLEVLDLFYHLKRAGEKTGYTFGDVTCGNIMVDKHGLHLIDLDIIVEWPLPKDYVHIWNNTLKIVFGD